MRKQRKRGPLTFTKLTLVHYVLGNSMASRPIIENAQLQFRIFPPFGRGVVCLRRRGNGLRLKGRLTGAQETIARALQALIREIRSVPADNV